jgi:hypothetical protein
MGCPPAQTVNIGGALCGDVTMSLLLGPGAYTLVLSDAANAANAVFDNDTLGEGFTDLTGGVFQTCNTDDTADTTCVNDTSNFSFDRPDHYVRRGGTTPTPEPSSLALLAADVLAVAVLTRTK